MVAKSSSEPLPVVPIPRKLIELFLRKFIPLVLEIGELFSKNAEANGLPPRINWWIQTYGVRGWARYYKSPFRLFLAYGEGIEDGDVAKLLNLDWSNVDLTCPDSVYAALWGAVEKSLLSDDLEPDLVDSLDAEQALVAKMSAEEFESHAAKMRKRVLASLVVMNNYFACMAYKKSMQQLVKEALNGNRKSFLQATHVDPSCLQDIAYFRKVITEAALSADDDFAARVQKWRQKPSLSSGVKLNGLYVVCYFLNLLGVLDQFKADMPRFAELCQSLGVYGPPMDEDAVDVESFAKVVRRFQAEHEAISFIPGGKLVVKDTH